VPNPTNPKPAAITAIAAEKRAESYISHCYSRKLWIKIKEAAKELGAQPFDGRQKPCRTAKCVTQHTVT
jgi:hypothetical protein